MNEGSEEKFGLKNRIGYLGLGVQLKSWRSILESWRGFTREVISELGLEHEKSLFR